MSNLPSVILSAFPLLVIIDLPFHILLLSFVRLYQRSILCKAIISLLLRQEHPEHPPNVLQIVYLPVWLVGTRTVPVTVWAPKIGPSLVLLISLCGSFQTSSSSTHPCTNWYSTREFLKVSPKLLPSCVSKTFSTSSILRLTSSISNLSGCLSLLTLYKELCAMFCQFYVKLLPKKSISR